MQEKTCKRQLLAEMEHVVPWAALVQLIALYYPEGKSGRPPFALETMLRVHFMQQWFCLSDPAMEEALFDTPLYREFAQLEEFGRLSGTMRKVYVTKTVLKLTSGSGLVSTNRRTSFTDNPD